jgi:hypothetical protein
MSQTGPRHLLLQILSIKEDWVLEREAVTKVLQGFPWSFQSCLRYCLQGWWAWKTRETTVIWMQLFNAYWAWIPLRRLYIVNRVTSKLIRPLSLLLYLKLCSIPSSHPWIPPPCKFLSREEDSASQFSTTMPILSHLFYKSSFIRNFSPFCSMTHMSFSSF